MPSFYDPSERHRQYTESLSMQYRQLRDQVEASEADLPPRAVTQETQRRFVDTYHPPELRRYGFNVGRAALKWLHLGDFYVEEMRDAAEQSSESNDLLPVYDEVQDINRNSIEAGSAWHVRTYATLWNEVTECKLGKRSVNSLVIGQFDPYAVEGQAWMTGLITAMSLRLRAREIEAGGATGEDTAPGAGDLTTEFTVPNMSWAVALARKHTLFATTYNLGIIESYGPGKRKQKLTRYDIHEREERVRVLEHGRDGSKYEPTGVAMLELAHNLSSDPSETIRIAQEPLARRARLFAAAEQGA